MTQKWQEWNRGTVIADRYHILETLGCGQVAITYLAFDAKNDEKRVVIKTIKPDLLNHLTESEIQDLKDKFWKEAVNISKCQHDHIVRFLDARKDRDTDLVYIIMEYIDGKSLASYQKIWSQKEALKYIHQIGDALRYIHEKDIIHCNLKPDNIILQNNRHNKAILIGFSLARTFNHPLTKVNINSADSFTPKELFSQEETGAFTDIYSLSATLYFLLTKERPPNVKDRTLSSRPGNYNKSELIEPKEIIKLSDRVNNAILKGMEIDPKKRPQSIHSLFEMLGLTDFIPRSYRNQFKLFLNQLQEIDPIIGILSFILGILGIILTILTMNLSDNSSLPPVSDPPKNEQHQKN